MRRSSNAFITALVVIVSSLAVAAQEPAQPQRGGRGGRGGQPPAEPGAAAAPAAPAASTAKPLIPVAASTLANNPDPYYGENVTMTGAVVVPIYQTNSPQECEWVIADSDSVAIIVENAAQLAKVVEVRDRLPHLRYVISIEPADGAV